MSDVPRLENSRPIMIAAITTATGSAAPIPMSNSLALASGHSLIMALTPMPETRMVGRIREYIAFRVAGFSPYRLLGPKRFIGANPSSVFRQHTPAFAAMATPGFRPKVQP